MHTQVPNASPTKWFLEGREPPQVRYLDSSRKRWKQLHPVLLGYSGFKDQKTTSISHTPRDPRVLNAKRTRAIDQRIKQVFASRNTKEQARKTDKKKLSVLVVFPKHHSSGLRTFCLLQCGIQMYLSPFDVETCPLAFSTCSIWLFRRPNCHSGRVIPVCSLMVVIRGGSIW